MDTTLLLALLPLAAIQLGLQIYALYDIYKRGGTRELPPVVWVIIVLVFNLIGAIAYFMLGRKEIEPDDDWVDDEL